MAKKNVKITMDETIIIAIKRIAKERRTSVSAMITAHMVETLDRRDKETQTMAPVAVHE